MKPAIASLAFHPAADANAAVHVLCAVLSNPLAILPVGGFHLAWARGDYDKLDSSAALDMLQADGWVQIEGEQIRLLPKGYARILECDHVPDLPLAMFGGRARGVADHYLRLQTLSVLTSLGSSAWVDSDGLTRAWVAAGMNHAQLRRGLDLCQASGHVRSKGRTSKQFACTALGHRWLAGRACPEPLLTLSPFMESAAIPPSITDDHLCRAALVAFKGKVPGDSLPTASVTHRLWRNRIPESLWFHGIEALHRFDYVDVDEDGELVLGHNGHQTLLRMGTLVDKLVNLHSVTRLQAVLRDYAAGDSDSGAAG